MERKGIRRRREGACGGQRFIGFGNWWGYGEENRRDRDADEDEDEGVGGGRDTDLKMDSDEGSGERVMTWTKQDDLTREDGRMRPVS